MPARAVKLVLPAGRLARAPARHFGLSEISDRLQFRPGSRRGTWSARAVISSVDAAGETILLHIPTGTYLGLDRSAAQIVELLNEDPDPRHAASALAERFGIPLERAYGDVSAVVAAVQGMSAPRTSRGRRPTVAGVRVVTRSWWRQTWPYRLAIVEVALAVGAIEVGLKFTDVSRLARWMHVPLAMDEVPPPAIGPDDLRGLTARERRIHFALYWVMARWVYDGTCLRRALALGWFLRRRGPVLRLGMLNEDTTIAHAWIEVEGRAFNAQSVTATFSSGVTGRASTGTAEEWGQTLA
jgi:Transglutaminase-like superfamily/Coenzyme PQQ synthesis protein D (PqqD)